VTFGVLRAVLALGVVLALADSRSCGFTPDDGKDEGEPCTRTSECRTALECRGGVCMTEAVEPDAGTPPDASRPFDASAPADASAPTDASAPADASASDGSTLDGLAPDAAIVADASAYASP
jgi:hypothetical protein